MPISAQDTGPLNAHFVHDLGLVFFMAGMGALYCGYKPKESLPIHFIVTFFLGGHALIHIIEILNGTLPESHWVIDFPLITLPALFLLGITPIITKLNRV